MPGQTRKSSFVTRPRHAAQLIESSAPAHLCLPSKSLLIIGGLPGVGKSQLAQRVLATKSLIISPDTLPNRRSPEGVDYGTWMYECSLQAAQRELVAGRPAIIDAPAVKESLTQGYRELAESQGVAVIALYLDGDIELAKRGQRERGGVFKKKTNINYAHAWSAMRASLFNDPWASKTYLLDRDEADKLQSISFD